MLEACCHFPRLVVLILGKFDQNKKKCLRTIVFAYVFRLLDLAAHPLRNLSTFQLVALVAARTVMTTQNRSSSNNVRRNRENARFTTG